MPTLQTKGNPMHPNIQRKSVSLQMPPQTEQDLKQAFAKLVEKIEQNKGVQHSDLKPMRDMLTAYVSSHSEFSGILKAAHNSDQFFILHLLHHDPEILNLPWILAADPHSGRALADISQIYLTRGLMTDAGEPFPDISPELAPLPLRILVMVSSPIDADSKSRLSFEDEEAAILHAFEPLFQTGAVEIHFTNNGSLSELKEKIQKNRYHILHFSGHGAFIDGQGYLQLEDEYSLKAKSASGEDFAKALLREDGYKIPMIMLSACQTAAGSVEKGFHSVTRELLQRGFPTVLAMSMSVGDIYATGFGAEFYAKLNQGTTILQAFREGLVCIRNQERSFYEKAKIPGLEPFQYLIPGIYSRSEQFRIFDPDAAAQEKKSLESYRHIYENSRFHKKVPDFIFVGRRKEKSDLLKPLFNHQTILLKGMGGVGKTALAIHLAQRYIARNPKAEPFFFNEESRSSDDVLKSLQKFLVRHGEKLSELNQELELFDKGLEKIGFLIERIIKAHDRIPVFIFDNLEAFQETEGGNFKPEHSDMAEVISGLAAAHAFPVILTARYGVPDIQQIKTARDMGEIGLTDFWKKCLYLDIREMRESQVRDKSGSDRKDRFFRIVEILHKAFGGNFRALEFFNEIWKKHPDEIQETLNMLDKLPEKHEKQTLIQMSENLVFSSLIGKLSKSQKEVLFLLSHFRIPVQMLALELQYHGLKQAVEEKKKLSFFKKLSFSADKEKEKVEPPKNLIQDLSALQNYTLIEVSRNPKDKEIYFYVTPIIKGLLRIGEAGSLFKGMTERISFSHQWAGGYFYALIKNDMASGVSEYSEAFEHFSLAGDKEKLQDIGKALANHYYKYSFYQNALLYCQKVEEICGDETDGWFYNQSGTIYHVFGKYDEALGYFQKALADDRAKGDRKGEGSSLNNISQIYQARDNYMAALRYLEQSLEISKEISYRKGEGATLNNISQIYHARGDYAAALRYLEQSLEISKEIGDRKGEGQSLNNISQIYSIWGDYTTALRYLEQSLEIQKKIGDRKGEGLSLNNISQIYDARGDYSTSLRYLKQSLEIQKKIGDRQGEGCSLNNISQIYSVWGDYAAALRYLEQSLEIRNEIGDRSGEGQSLNNISQIYFARGDYSVALRYLEQSLEISKEIGDRKGEEAALNNIGQIYSARGDYVSALRYLEQSLEISKEIGDRSGLCATLFNMGHIHWANKEKEKAFEKWLAVYAIAKEIGEAQALSALDDLAKKLGGTGLENWEALLARGKSEP